MHEHVVHTLDDAVTVHPDVLTIGIAPIAVDPDPIGTPHYRLRQGSFARCWRRLLRGRGWLGLLHHDDRLAVHLLGDPFFDFDDDILRSAIGFRRDLRVSIIIGARIAVVIDFENVTRPIVVVARRSLVLGARRRREPPKGHPCRKGRELGETSHHLIIRSPAGSRHPSDAERAPPARQSDEKMLGLARFEWTHER
jgi:hypothetical protein